MKTFKLVYKISEGPSWKAENSIDIKSNLAEDKLIDCQLAESLVEHLKKESVILEPDKLLLSIAEAQKREIETIIDDLSDMELSAKVNMEKTQEVLQGIILKAENIYSDLEKKFSDTQKLFTDKMKTNSENIEKELEKLTLLEEKLEKINSYKLNNLTETLDRINTLVDKDKELVKLVLDYKINS